MGRLIRDLLDQPMNRREFLIRLGVVMITLTGISSVLRALVGSEGVSRAMPQRSGGYGSSPYGGSGERKLGVRPAAKRLG
jgi:hypothetical protein